MMGRPRPLLTDSDENSASNVDHLHKESKPPNEQQVSSLADLQSGLEILFQSDHVNVEEVQKLMEAYEGIPEDWEKFENFKRENLTRNLVGTGNGKFNLILVCWEGGHQSTIHDHSNCHCFMKIIKGSLDEIRYAWPEQNSAGGNVPLTEITRLRLSPSEVSYINDQIGLHRMENASKKDRAISLHLYCPPFGACRVFDKDTGRNIQCPVTFYTKFGGKPLPND